MEKTGSFRLNEPHVMAQAVDNHLVLVHFESGYYYSLSGTAADVSRLLAGGCSLPQIATRLADHHQVTVAQVTCDLEAFVARLVDEQLLMPAPERGLMATDSSVAPRASVYEAPAFAKYDDMADQLLLDKVEDATCEGSWLQQAVVMAHCQ